MDKIINVETMKQETEGEKMTRNRLNEEDTTETNLLSDGDYWKKCIKMTLRQNKWYIGPYSAI